MHVRIDEARKHGGAAKVADFGGGAAIAIGVSGAADEDNAARANCDRVCVRMPGAPVVRCARRGTAVRIGLWPTQRVDTRVDEQQIGWLVLPAAACGSQKADHQRDQPATHHGGSFYVADGRSGS
jgi:hypothetical protein